MKRAIFSALAFGTVFFLFVSVAKAQTSVDHVAGRLEKVQEKIGLILQFSKEKKTDYQLVLLEKRLAELTYAVENDVNLVEPTASRYATYVGRLGDYVTAKKVIGRKEKVIETFSAHAERIRKLQEEFEFESGWWLAIQHDINNTQIFSEKLKSL